MLFYVDTLKGISKSYQDLVDDIINLNSYTRYCYTDNYYEIFKHIVHSMLLGEEIILLDSDFSFIELKNLIGHDLQNEYSFVTSVDFKQNLSIDRLSKLITENSLRWKVTLFTSGTTGLPKKISHSFDSITRFVQLDSNHKNDIWGFAYNPTHMAGLQVFFQAFLNFNPLIRLFKQDKDAVLSLIEKYAITHLSATPTFYRLLLPSNTKYLSIKKITCGGEKFDEHAANQLLDIFPKAKITNVYASTEAGTLFATQDEYFYIKEKYKDLIKIENDLLFIHHSLMGESDSVQLNGEWYNTGDLIEVVSNLPFKFKFVSRQNEMINVGGYKVNPTEVEQVIRAIRGVQDVFVFGKRNSLLGNVICCEVVAIDKTLSELNIREYLMQHLQEFKIPRVIKFVDLLTTTRTGKILRNKIK